MAINGSTFISQTTLFLRSSLASGIVDPLSGTRASNEPFVMTSYPEKPVKYPIITVKSLNPTMIQRGGMQSQDTYDSLPFEIRVWARNEREKDHLAEDVSTWLRLNQFSGTYSTITQGLFGFNRTSMVDVDENDKQGVKSKVMEFEWRFVNI